MQDEEGLRGVALSREIPNVAGDAITVNLKTLGPKVLPGGEKIKVQYPCFCLMKFFH